MIFGVILAGGSGTRMGNIDKPKQFLAIGNKPILVHTVEKFILCSEFEKIIVLTPEQWMSYTKDLLKKHIPDMSRIEIVQGGTRRNETIMNAISYVDKNYGLDKETYFVTHDAVRPFVTYRIIKENIDKVKKGSICNTVIPATDTIVESKNGKVISDIPDRACLYQGQTPQSFNARMFKKLYESLSTKEKEKLTDASKVFVIKGYPVELIKGETFNIKVTYPYDLQLAETLLNGEKNA